MGCCFLRLVGEDKEVVVVPEFVGGGKDFLEFGKAVNINENEDAAGSTEDVEKRVHQHLGGGRWREDGGVEWVLAFEVFGHAGVARSDFVRLEHEAEFLFLRDDGGDADGAAKEGHEILIRAEVVEGEYLVGAAQ